MLTLIDATDSSLTMSWSAIPGAVKYVLQFKAHDEDNDFETLSDKLTSQQARKRNLKYREAGYDFRVGPIRDGDAEQPQTWLTSTEPFKLLTAEEMKSRMAKPKVMLAGKNEALLVKWEAEPSSDAYTIQMRQNDGGAAWETVAQSFAGTEVRKKHLNSPNGYQFRLRPADQADGVFSEPSDAVVALGLSRPISNLLRGISDRKLLKDPKTKISLADAVGGKEFILMYASAHWCGPCRQFTPMLTKWYQSLGQSSPAEVVFLSADHDEQSFSNYFASMPWLAIDYDEDAREQLMGYFKVSGIPRLVVLDGRTGQILVENAVGQQLDLQQWRRLAASKK